MTLGIQLAKTPPKVHGGWQGTQLRSNTIIEVWADGREVFGKLRTKDTLMTDIDREIDEEDVASQPLLTPTKELCFKNKGSIFKVFRHTRKTDSAESQGHFKPRYDIKPKNKRDNFRKMAFKTYLQVSLPIDIQYVIEYGATETKTLEVLTEIWKEILSVNRYSVILSWYLKTEYTLRPLTSIDCTETLTKKVVNDKYIELLPMGWSTSNITICFRLDHNLSIDALLEDSNLGYSVEKFDADLTRDRIQSIDTVIAVWLRGPIPEQTTLEVIEQILVDSKEFKRLEVDQVQLFNKRIILKLGKQPKGDKKVSAIHVVVPEDKKAQARKALKAIYPCIP